MKTTYLVWKDPSCNGINPDWQELSGKEFLALVRSDEGRRRHFIRLDSIEPNGADGAIVMEATQVVYADWKREKNRNDYLNRVNGEYTIVSYYALEGDDGSYGEELLADEDTNTENECLSLLDEQALNAALDFPME